MLEQLFGSKTRVRLLRLFLLNPKEAYFVRELTRRIDAQINAVRNELEHLLEIGIIVEVKGPDGELVDPAPRGRRARPQGQQKKFYMTNTESLLFPELKALFLKARLLLEKDFVQRVAQAGSVNYLALTGFFVGDDANQTDMVVIGRVNKDRLANLIAAFEREIGRELNYTVLTPQEYRYRREVTDRFLYSILESKKIVVIDTLTERVPVLQ